MCVCHPCNIELSNPTVNCRGHGGHILAASPSHANEAMDVDWMGSQTCEPVPANEIGMGDCYSQLAISGFYSFCMHLDITNYHQKMERMGEENHSSDRHLDQEVQAKCVLVSPSPVGAS